MRITHHKDGTYSLTGMTRDDVDDLAFAVGIAHGWYVMNGPSIGAGDDWSLNRTEEYRQLETVLMDACRWSGAIDGRRLPAGRSIELDSTVWRGRSGRWAVIRDGRVACEAEACH